MPLELPPHLTTSDSLRSEEVVMFYWAGESQGDTLVVKEDRVVKDSKNES